MRRFHFYQNQKGKHCFIRKLNNGRCLKIFDAYPLENWDNLKDFKWGDPPKDDDPSMSVPLIEATKIQNIAAMHGLAPRVFNIVQVRLGNNKYWGQEIEYLNGEYPEDRHEIFVKPYDKVKELGKEYGFETEKDDVSRADIINDKLVDFNTFHFTKDHEEKIKKIYIEKARYGKVYYHGVKEWGLKGGPRDNEARVKYMKLKRINFKGKSVLDLGCAGGFFCRYAKDRKAKEIIGIDYPDVKGSDPVLAAKLVSNELGYCDIDFHSSDLRRLERPIWFTGDIVFFLSMNFHIGIPDWLPRVTKDICIFEDNSKERNAEQTLTTMFKKVKLVGKAKDHGNKPIYLCYK